MSLSPVQLDVLTALGRVAGSLRVAELATALGVDQSQVAAAVVELTTAGVLETQESAFDELRPGPDARNFAAAPLPERVIMGVLAAQGGSCVITQIPQHCPLSSGQIGQSLRWLTQRGWAVKDGERLVAQPADWSAAQPDELLLCAVLAAGTTPAGDLASRGIDVAAALAILSKRKGLVTVKPRTDRRASITDAGRRLLADGATARRTVTQLTPELLADGGWRNVTFQAYDVSLPAKARYPGKEHAFQRTLDRVRRVFLEMGFTEIVSPWVESSFWDFDALFQPQDHPARDMQDTFYVARPQRTQLPDAALVQRVRDMHEHGGDCGSTGWGYRWNPELASRPVLRTHTTAATIRALAAHARSAGGATRPGKYFVIGPVNRRETVDYKHLPVFHQVDGIVVDPQANFSTLLGTLQAFYAKMGFPKVRFRPSFFPYTEPSAEVFLWLEHRGEWVEMGGSGMFRPEVTHPLGIRQRVLAWGLGLERLAMMIHNLKSIGELYFANMPWLRETPLRRA